MPTVRETLDSIEQELLGKIEKLRGELVPLEGELADVRRAKAALTKSEGAPRSASFSTSIAPVTLTAVGAVAYQSLTMKELTLKALKEQFPQGAKAGQLLEHFRNAWGRGDIVRSSLSPQLSRLQMERKIHRTKGNVWVLGIRPEKNEAPTEDQSEGASGGSDGDAPLFR